MANSSLHTGSVGHIWVNFLGFNRLPANSNCFKQAKLPWLSVTVFLLPVRRLTLAISWFVNRNWILCEAAFTLFRMLRKADFVAKV